MQDYRNRKLSPRQRTRDLLSRMSVTEKIGQLLKLDGFRSYEWMNGKFTITDEFKSFYERFPVGTMSVLLRADWWTKINWQNGIHPKNMREAVTAFQRYALEHSRWRIPLYMMEEASHGLMALGATVFPTGLGLGAMWDEKLMYEIGRTVGREVAATGVQATHGPVLDIIRDIRWSRTEENYAEDPYLTEVYAERYVKGLVAENIVPTLKHFCGYGSPEGGRNSAPTHAGPIEMFNCQLRPFVKAIQAGARSVMSAYNSVDQELVSGSHYYLTKLLRDKFHFDGFVVSDRGAIPQLQWKRCCREAYEASAMALKAGCDVDNGRWEFHAAGLIQALEKGAICEADLDTAAGRVLKLKFELGLFDNPFPGGDPVTVLGCAEHRKIALEAARKSLTLLKNNGVLPLRFVKTIALIGPNIDNVMNQIGDYSAPQREGAVVTPLAGLQAYTEKYNIRLLAARGCGIRNRDRGGFAEAREAAAAADVIIFIPGGSSTKYGSTMTRTDTGAAISEVVNEELSEKESGEGTDRAFLQYSGVQMELFRELCQLNKPLVTVPIQGRVLLMEELLNHSDALLMAWYPGGSGGQAIAEALFGDYNPAGRLPLSIPRAEGQLPVFYNVVQERMAYVDCPGTALLSFGYGLSYTRFAYKNLQINNRTVSVEVANIGDYDGEEVVQCYLTALASPIQRPNLELCGFRRVFIGKGKSEKIVFELTDHELGCSDRHGNWSIPSRYFKISVGGNPDALLSMEVMID